VISALGLWNESTVSPLNPTQPDPRRHFRSSNVVNFRGYIALERLSCGPPLAESVKHVEGHIVPRPGKGDNTKPYVRVRVCNRLPIYMTVLLIFENRLTMRLCQFLVVYLDQDQHVPCLTSQNISINGAPLLVTSLMFVVSKMLRMPRMR
jgi:hypothetical protein